MLSLIIASSSLHLFSYFTTAILFIFDIWLPLSFSHVPSFPTLDAHAHLRRLSAPSDSFLYSCSLDRTSPSLFLSFHSPISVVLCVRACVSACVCGGSLPCLAGVRSRERGLDRRSTLWQNRNRISWGELTQQASLLPLPPSLSVCLSLSLLLSPSVRTKLPDSDSHTRCERKDSGAASRRESILASKSHFTHFSRLVLSFSLIFTEQWNKNQTFVGEKHSKHRNIQSAFRSGYILLCPSPYQER